MQKARGDFIRKLETLRRECEEKIIFLLHQLRAAESSNRRSSPDTPAAYFDSLPDHNASRLHLPHPPSPALISSNYHMPPSNKEQVSSGLQIQTNMSATADDRPRRPELRSKDTSSDNFTSLNSSSLRHNPHSVRAQSAGDVIRHQSTKIRLTDSMLSEQLALESTELDKETLRRWQTEKNRREQLEKVNADMARELRNIRQQIQLVERQKK